MVRIFRSIMADSAEVPGRLGKAGALDARAVFALLGNQTRWAILRILADGQARTATEMAAVLKRDFDGVSKQLRLLRQGGLVVAFAGEDRRFLYFRIPAHYRQTAGVFDFGVCTVKLP